MNAQKIEPVDRMQAALGAYTQKHGGDAAGHDGVTGVHLVSADAVELSELDSVDGSRALSRVAWSPSPATLLAQGAQAAALLDSAFNRAAVLDQEAAAGELRCRTTLRGLAPKRRKQRFSPETVSKKITLSASEGWDGATPFINMQQKH